MKKYGLFLLAIFLIAQSVAFSQNAVIKDAKKDLPNLLGTSNSGNEFWVSFPPCYEEVAGAENTTRIFVASGVRQPVTVDVPGKGWSMTKMAVANDVIEFKLPSNVGQPYSKPTTAKAPPEQVYGGAGVHVTAIAPIVVYGMTRFQYTSDGFLGVPVSGIGTDYVVASWPQYTAAGSNYKLPGLTNIVASYDDTEVTFIMGGVPGSRTTGGLRPGQTKKWTGLKAGDVICIANDDDGQDIAGSRIVANKPVGVVSGNQCANVPAGVPWCDFTVDMELPTNTWGKEYHVTALVDRMFNPVIRVFAHPDYKNIKVYRDGKEWLVLPNNSRVENQAFVERRLQDGPPKSTMISANAPIYIMLYNTGQADDNVSSDPFQYVITPVEQYQKEIVFCTPNAKGGTLPFTKNYVNLVYALGDGDVVPDDLEFAVVNNGKFEWRSVASRFGAGPGQIFSAPTANGLKYGMKRITLPGDGVYRIRAKQPFAAYSYGYSDYDSYGFPTSVALGDLTKKDTVNPNPEYKVLCDGSVEGPDGKLPIVTDLPNDPNVRSNLAIVYMDIEPDSSFNYEFKIVDQNGKPTKIIPGSSVRTFWTLKVINPAIDARARLIFVDKAGNDTAIVIKYNAFQVKLEKSPMDYGLVMIGAQKTLSFKAVNNSDASVVVHRLELMKRTEGFTIFENDGVTPAVVPFTLAGKAEKEFKVTFMKDVVGDFLDSIGVGDDCRFGYSIEVRAKTGEPEIVVTQDANFGQKPVNSTGHSWPFTVRNAGTADLVVTGFTLPTSPEFVIKYNNVLLTTAMINDTKPLIIKPGGIENFSVEFSPTAVKQYSDQIYFKSNAKKSDSIEVMTGEAIEPGLYAQGYNWDRKRVLSNNLYNRAVWVTNTGNAPLTINDVTPSNPNDKNFQYSGGFGAWKQLYFVGKTLQPKTANSAADTIFAPVDFVPESIMEKSLDLTFTTNETKPATAKLLGTGIIGRLRTSPVDFGTTKLDNGVRVALQEVAKKVRFEFEDYQYSDNVTITLPFIMDANEIVASKKLGNIYGSQGFAHDLVGTIVANPTSAYDAIAGTVTLTKSGDYVEFEAYFNGEFEKDYTTNVTTESDAEAEVTAVLTGKTENVPSGNGILNTTPNVLPIVCIGEPTPQKGSIEVLNTGDADLIITGVTYNPAIDANSAPWSVNKDFAPAYFTLTKFNTAYDRDTLYYDFKAPNTPGVYTLDVTVTSNAPTNGTQTKTLRGETVAYSGSLGIDGEGSALQYGKDYVYTINLSTATAPTRANINKMTFTVAYPTQMFVYRGNVQVLNPAWELDGTPTVANGVVTISLKSSSATPVSANTTPYIAIPFFTVLSSDPTFVQGGKASINVTATANDCFPISPTSMDVSPQAVCFAPGRAVGGSGLGQGNIIVTPNPVPSIGGKVNFSIGIQSTTTLIIYTATGEEVTTMPLGILQPGEYEVTLPMDKLSSGSYTAKFVSGPYTEVKPFAVTK